MRWDMAEKAIRTILLGLVYICRVLRYFPPHLLDYRSPISA